MAYRKFKADAIFTGSTFTSPETVLVTDETGQIHEIISVEDAGDGIEELQGVLAPGFINAHCHLELSHMKGKIPPATGLVDFLIKVIRERGASAEEIAEAMKAAESEMYRNGIVAVADTCNTNFSDALKQQSPIHWRNFVEVIGFTESQAGQRIRDAEKTLRAFKHKSSLTPHAPYSVSARLFELIGQHSSGNRISIHNQESTAELDLYANGRGDMFRLYENLGIDASFFQPSGKSSLKTYLPLLENASAVILVHNTYITEEDIRFAVHSRGANSVFFCLCPNANNYIESNLPPAEKIRALGGRIVLGTDSYASNWQLNILEEMKSLHTEYTHIPVAEILEWSTLNGAIALEIDEEFGSFQPGKKPGVNLLTGINEAGIARDAAVKKIL